MIVHGDETREDINGVRSCVVPIGGHSCDIPQQMIRRLIHRSNGKPQFGQGLHLRVDGIPEQDPIITHHEEGLFIPWLRLCDTLNLPFAIHNLNVRDLQR